MFDFPPPLNMSKRRKRFLVAGRCFPPCGASPQPHSAAQRRSRQLFLVFLSLCSADFKLYLSACSLARLTTCLKVGNELWREKIERNRCV